MSGIARIAAGLVLLALAVAAPAQPAQPRELAALQGFVRDAIARAEPSVACILVSRSDQYRQLGMGPPDPSSGLLGRFTARDSLLTFPNVDDRRRRSLTNLDLSHPDHVPEAFGSGVVIDESGLILTCAHVVRNATKLYVRLSGNRGSWADIHALDPRSDLAVLRLLDRVAPLRAVPLGDATHLKKGQFVISLANPFAAGFRDGSPSASWGIVSNLRRRAPGGTSETDRGRQTLHQFGTLIQTDVRLNLGCSGGALLDLDGTLIGMTTALAALGGGETPAGYAIPLDDGLRRAVEKLRRGEEVEYGFLGVSLDPANRPGPAVQVGGVAPGSPADRARLQRGDFVFAVNGVPVHENDDLFLQIGVQMANAEVRLETARSLDGPRQVLRTRLAKYLVQTPGIASKRPPAHGGLRVDHTSILSQRPGLPAWVKGIPVGVVIREVVPGSPADKARLQPDKVITRVNGEEVANPADYYDKAARSPNRLELTLLTSDGREENVLLAGRSSP